MKKTEVRVYLDDKEKNQLKNEAKKFGLTLPQYLGVKIRGFELKKTN